MAYGSVNVTGVTLAELQFVKAALQQAIDDLRSKVEKIESTDPTIEYDDSALKKAISELEKLVGSVAVSEQIAKSIENALKIDGADKYALASALRKLEELVGDTAVSKQISAQISAAIEKIESDMEDKAEADHEHNASDITDGILPVERGGTGNANGYAPRAMADSAGNQILNTYIKDVEAEEGKLMLIYGDGRKKESTYPRIQSGRGKVGPIDPVQTVIVKFDRAFESIPVVTVSGHFTTGDGGAISFYGGGVFYVMAISEEGFSVTAARGEDSAANYAEFSWIAVC